MISPERRAVFFDRDATLMEEEDHCDHPSRVRAALGVPERPWPGCVNKGWLNIITNQKRSGRGYFTMADYEQVNAELFRQLNQTIDAAYCSSRPPGLPPLAAKPGIGMVEEAVADHWHRHEKILVHRR